MRSMLSLSLVLASFSLTAGCSSAEESDGSTDEANATAAAVTQAPPSCNATEATIFTCKTTKGKVIAVCASRDVGPTRGYIQYRFGTSQKTELKLPDDSARSSFRQVATYYESDPADSGSRYYGDIRFSKEAYAYAVYTHVGGGVEGAGVRVTKNGEEVADIACDGGYSQLDLEAVRAAGVRPTPND